MAAAISDSFKAMHLSEYVARRREQTGETMTEIAESLGLKVLALRRYASGARHPRPATIARIHRLTAGAVRPGDWYPDDAEAAGPPVAEKAAA